MTDNFDEVFAELEAWRLRTYREAALAISAAAPALETKAKATDIYGDDTGATRGSTVAYVVDGSGQVDESSKADAAYLVAEDRNPGSGSDDYETVESTEVACFLTSFTNYAIDLETSRGGFIGPVMDELGPTLHKAAEQGLKRSLT